MSEEFEFLKTWLWAPFVGYVMFLARGYRQDTKQRDKEIGLLKERTAVVEATRMTREDVTEFIDNKFDKLENKIDKLSDDVSGLVKDQYKSSTNYNKIVNVISRVTQDYENFIVEAAEAVLFGNAEGEQLDEIGRQLDVPRTVDDDDQYRALLALYTLRRTTTGTRGSLYDTLNSHSAESLRFAIGADNQVDVNLFTGCIAGIHGIQSIIELLPLNTNYRIVETEGTPFGFDDDDGGFAGIELSLIHISEPTRPY